MACVGDGILDFAMCLWTWGFRSFWLCRVLMPLWYLHVIIFAQPAFAIRPMLGAGIRYGDASNPGPDTVLKFAVTNPTCVSNKFDVYCDLLDKIGCNVISLSETAATDAVQKQLTSKFKAKKCKILWSPAVPPLTTTVSRAVHTRGRASGVALLANVPIRPSRLDMSQEWTFTTRFKHVIAQFGQSHIQLAVLYCKPVHGHVGVDYNSKLLRCALEQIRVIPLPFVILGDFNMNVQQFDAWDELAAMGCKAVTQIFHERTSTQLPPTCNGVTWPDNAIVSHHLVQGVQNIQVLDPTWFATHSPLVFDLTMPGHAMFHMKLRLPKSFVDLAVDDQDLQCMDNDSWFQHVTNLGEWAEAVEHGVHTALCEGAGTRQSLPKSFRGRCKKMKVIRSPICASVRPACQGAYEPCTEVVSMPCRRKVTQVRRLESLYGRFKKLAPDQQRPISPADVSREVWQQLRHEWRVIWTSTAFGSSFLHWLSQFPDMALPQHPLPSPAWTFEAYQLSKHFLECALRDEIKISKARLGYAEKLDRDTHLKHAYARVRGPGPPPVVGLAKRISFEVFPVATPDGTQHDLFADATDLELLDFAFPVKLGDHVCPLLRIESHHAVVSSPEPIAWPDPPVTLTQEQLTMDPREVAKCLDQYWQPIWQRDPADLSFVDQTLQQQAFHAFLANMPVPANIQIDLLDVSIWNKCIKKLRTASARGTDGISAQELKMLPQAAIRSLAALMDSQEDPFGLDFMDGLVAPLSKSGSLVPETSQTRPITILPQLYRLWASVICSQIAAVFATWAPDGITGFLPKRGAISAAIRAQFQLELAHHRRIALSGLVLDLKKCFNNISWAFAFHALAAAGVPPRFLKTWILMQSRHLRHWLIGGECFHSSTGTTGLPEGDQWSVLAIVCISIGWISHLQAALPDASLVSFSAYADNWSWSSDEWGLHATLLQLTQKYTEAAGLALDWTKTWYWATSKAHARAIEDALQQVADIRIARKLFASDLGFQIQYGKKNQLGIHSDRLSAGLQRLTRLAGLGYNLSVKERILVTSIYPVALHGTETKPPVQESFIKLRSQAARALYGDAHSMSPAIALLFGKKTILDPEFHFVVRLIATVRRFVASLAHRDQVDFFAIASRFHGTLAKVHGPAASLAFTLTNLGWQINNHGVIHVTAFVSLPLLTTSLQRIRRFLSLAWQCKLVQTFTCRYSWFHFPDISVCDTRDVLNNFHDAQRAMLIREIAGGYQLESQKQKWVDTSDGTCVFCDLPDSRSHRMLECPIGHDIREPFLSLLHEIEDDGSCVVDFPVVMVHPDLEPLYLSKFVFAPQTWTASLVAQLHEIEQRGILPHFYTDGSCQFPTSPTTRFAAFSVVLDLCNNDMERCEHAERFRYAGNFTSSFHVVSTSMCEGEQDILRAEMSAICEVVVNTSVGKIFSDSQSALNLVNLALTANTVTEFLDKEHFDLLLKIYARRNAVNFDLVKVKAHKDIPSITKPLDRYHAMGNWYADATAESARDNTIPILVKEHWRINDELERDKERLVGVYRLHLQLMKNRLLNLQQEQGDPPPHHGQDDLWNAFKDWKVQENVFTPAPASLDLLSFAAYGEEIAKITYDWLMAIRWPQEADGPLHYNAGTSWIELGLSWMFYHQRWLPILRKDHRGTMKLRFLADFQDAKDHHFSFSEAGTIIEKIISHVISLIPQQIFPKVTRHKCASLYLMGSKQYHQGLAKRVELPAQQEVVALLQSTFSGTNAAYSMQGTPMMPFTGQQATFPETWTERCTIAGRGMYRARKIRRN